MASGARIGGIRILDGNGIYDQTEAAALSWNRNHVDIYSCSWGPNDTLAIYDGPRFLTRKALREGTTFGRDGLGSLFVWAAGNGGHTHTHTPARATHITFINGATAS